VAEQTRTSQSAHLERRKDPELAGAFAKDPAGEAFLDKLNALLGPTADAELADLDETYPTLHIVGAPRSGTTLLYQALASGLEIGYVNNLVAAFWRAPTFGIQLSRKLGLDRLESSFDSRFGRTRDVREPHEFGYFWNAHLRYPDLREQAPGHEETIDWEHLRLVLLNMADRNGGPMAFKPMLLVWHLETMLRHLPRTCYVWIRRDPVQTALSLLSMRRSLLGSEERWASLRPRGTEWLDGEPPWRQVAAQVILLERTIGAAAGRMGPEHVLALRYEEFCAAPNDALERIRVFLGGKGHVPAVRGAIPPFEQRRSSLEVEYGARVEQAFAELAQELGAGGRS
jgi:hypothetical protein